VDFKNAAGRLSNSKQSIQALIASIKNGDLRKEVDRFTAYHAAQSIGELLSHLQEWHGFFSTYDPMFDWWVKAEWEGIPQAFQDLIAATREHLVGIGADDQDAIVGQPSGRERIIEDLKTEVIPYSPEELIKMGELEYEWCEKEMIKASEELGHGKKWKKALEHVKQMYVEPGQQIYMVRELADEAVEYVTKNDMVTIPAVARDAWRTIMMSPERQKVNPFFLGGPLIQVSYPTNTMAHEDKLMIMRGNNRPFSRSTVFHELLPGHHLQWYYMDRKPSVPFACIFNG
jgi:uncharacterized protein (DUF885 family)